MGNAIIISAGFMLLAFIMLLFFVSRYKRCPTDKILVVYGKVEESKYEGIKLINGGATFVWPVIQEYEFLDLSHTRYDFKVETNTKDLVPINLSGSIIYSISNQEEIAVKAAYSLLGKSKKEIGLICQDVINSTMIDFIATQDIIDIASSKKELIQNIAQKINKELNKIGVSIFNFRLDRIEDKKSLIKKYEQKFNTTNYLNPDENLNKQLDEINKKIKNNSLEREKLLNQKLKILTTRK